MNWMHLSSAVLLLLLLDSSIYTVQQHHVALVFSFGALVSQITEPGLHLKSFWQTQHQVQVTTQEDTYSVHCHSKAGVKLRVDIRVGHTLHAHHAFNIANETGFKNYEWKYFGGPIDQYMQSFASSSTTEEIIATKKNEIAPSIEARLRENLHHGLKLDYVRIGAIDAPEDITNAYRKREVTRAQIQTSEHQKKISEIKADEEAEVSKRQADAILYARKKESDAVDYSRKLERDAEQKRHENLAAWYERLSKTPHAVNLRKIDTINPNVKVIVVPDKDGGIYHIGGAADTGL